MPSKWTLTPFPEFINGQNLPRLFELADINTAFSGYLKDSDIPALIPVKRKVLCDFEADLSALDGEAWAFFKEKTQYKSCLEGGYSQKASSNAKVAKEKGYDGLELPRSWQPLFDLRNEARGYGYLKSIGCGGIEFIPESKAGRRTPDLKGMLGGQTVLCEVKTINKSDDAVASSFFSLVTDGQPRLSDGFFNQIDGRVKDAIKQIEDYHFCNNPLMIVYLFLNFDDILGEYLNKYIPQLDCSQQQWQNSGVKIVFDYFQSGYWASP